ncbi:PfkB family carbohydrate kinase [Streptomyces atratus]|uniref:PfkB family carbohydrate kinase n=1 Tax=Streptomyces atratus TaxID=1893 RepID=UPI00130069A6|nr:PfkB family carbohydrate kinase [Streptomyces atratus]
MNTFTQGRIVVIGSVNIDRILRCPVLPTPGETVLAASAGGGFGGKGANQAVAAATTGAATYLVAKVGGDTGGLKALADLRSASVDVDAVITEGSTQTGEAIVVVDSDGEKSIVVVGGANALLSAQDVADAMTVLRPQAGDVVLTSGEVPQPCLLAAAEVLPAEVWWIHNAAPTTALPARPRGLGPLLVVNAVEAQRLTGADEVTWAARSLAAQGRGAVVTLGGDGALVAEGGRVEHLTAPSVTVVDTTGAGDVFCGVLAAELSHGTPLSAAAATATAAGAFAVTALGARGALPRRRDLDRLLNR